MSEAQLIDLQERPIKLTPMGLTSLTWEKEGLTYDGLRGLLPRVPKEKSSNISSKVLSELNAGIFRIRWANALNFSERTAIINVSYGYKGHRSQRLRITSYPKDILYIGKAYDMRERIQRIFSNQDTSNLVARKIEALITGASTSNLNIA